MYTRFKDIIGKLFFCSTFWIGEILFYFKYGGICWFYHRKSWILVYEVLKIHFRWYELFPNSIYTTMVTVSAKNVGSGEDQGVWSKSVFFLSCKIFDQVITWPDK